MQESNQGQSLVGSSSSPTSSSSVDMSAQQLQTLRKNSDALTDAALEILPLWGVEDDVMARFFQMIANLTSVAIEFLDGESLEQGSIQLLKDRFASWLLFIKADESLGKIMRLPGMEDVFYEYNMSVNEIIKAGETLDKQARRGAQISAASDFTHAEIGGEPSFVAGPCSSTDTRRSSFPPPQKGGFHNLAELVAGKRTHRAPAAPIVVEHGTRVDCVIEEFIGQYPAQLDLLITLSETEVLSKLEQAVEARNTMAAEENFFALKAILSTVDPLCASYLQDLVLAYYPSLRNVYLESMSLCSSTSVPDSPAFRAASPFFNEMRRSDTPRPSVSSSNHSDEEDKTRICPLSGEHYDPNEPFVSKRRTSPSKGNSAS